MQIRLHVVALVVATRRARQADQLPGRRATQPLRPYTSEPLARVEPRARDVVVVLLPQLAKTVVELIGIVMNKIEMILEVLLLAIASLVVKSVPKLSLVVKSVPKLLVIVIVIKIEMLLVLLLARASWARMTSSCPQSQRRNRSLSSQLRNRSSQLRNRRRV